MKIFLALFILISSFLNAGSIALDDPNIQYRGTKFPEITANSATLYRFPNKELFRKPLAIAPHIPQSPRKVCRALRFHSKRRAQL